MINTGHTGQVCVWDVKLWRLKGIDAIAPEHIYVAMSINVHQGVGVPYQRMVKFDRECSCVQSLG